MPDIPFTGSNTNLHPSIIEASQLFVELLLIFDSYTLHKLISLYVSCTQAFPLPAYLPAI